MTGDSGQGKDPACSLQDWLSPGYLTVAAGKSAGDVWMGLPGNLIRQSMGAIGCKAVAIAGDGLHAVAAGSSIWTR